MLTTRTFLLLLPHVKRTQTWLATKIPNPFILQEGGTCYLRVKPKGGKQTRIALRTKSFAVAKYRMREKLLELGVGTGQANSGTWGSLIEPWRTWLAGEKTKKVIGDSAIEYKIEVLDQIRKTWPNWDNSELTDIGEMTFAAWAVKHRGTIRQPGRTAQ